MCVLYWMYSCVLYRYCTDRYKHTGPTRGRGPRLFDRECGPSTSVPRDCTNAPDKVAIERLMLPLSNPVVPLGDQSVPSCFQKELLTMMGSCRENEMGSGVHDAFPAAVADVDPVEPRRRGGAEQT